MLLHGMMSLALQTQYSLKKQPIELFYNSKTETQLNLNYDL
jgi:hypothetical protein